MKWTNRIQITTGQTCLHISLHLLLIAIMLWSWKHHSFIQISMILLGGYYSLFAVMLLMQRTTRMLILKDFLEDVTTNYYFGASILMLLLLSRVIQHSFLLSGIGLLILAGPAAVSLLMREPAKKL